MARRLSGGREPKPGSVPGLGANRRAGENGAFGLSLYGNGGMNANWPTGTFYAVPDRREPLADVRRPHLPLKLGGRHALGVTAIGAMQWFKTEGVGSFPPFSTAPLKPSNNGNSCGFGAGARLGYLGEWSRFLSVGASYQTQPRRRLRLARSSTVGFSKLIDVSQEISLAIMRAFSHTVSGPNPLEVPGLQRIDLQLDQWDFGLSWSLGINQK